MKVFRISLFENVNIYKDLWRSAECRLYAWDTVASSKAYVLAHLSLGKFSSTLRLFNQPNGQTKLLTKTVIILNFYLKIIEIIKYLYIQV